MSAWCAVAWCDDIGAGALLATRIGNRELLVYRGAGGTAHATEATDPRRGFPLVEGEVVGDQIRSAIDGWTWSLDGSGTDNSGTAHHNLPTLAHFPVREWAGLVLTRTDDAKHAAPEVATDADAQPVTWDDADGNARSTSFAGHPLVALENLADAATLGFLLGFAVDDPAPAGPQDDGALRLRFSRADDPARAIIVQADGPYLLRVSDEDGGHALMALTPLAPPALELRASVTGAPNASSEAPDWIGLVRRQAELIPAVRRAVDTPVPDALRSAGLEIAREWLEQLPAGGLVEGWETRRIADE